MRRHLILTILTCGVLAFLSPQASAQTDDPLAETKRLNNQCLELQNAGKYGEALEPCQRALAIGEKILGSEHTDVATLLNNLAELYRAKGDYEKTEPLHLRALAIREKALGGEHPLVATSLNNLALLYQAKGDYAKAEPLYQRALDIFEKTFGSEHQEVATSLNNLALLYQAKGDYAKAEPLLHRTLAIYEKVLGSEHPLVATSLNNLASLYRDKGDYTQAEPLYQRALAIYEKALGREHPTVATSLNNLAELYRTKGEYAKAEPLLQRALAINEKALGSEHPLVATSLYYLARLYRAKGEYTKAELLSQRALAIDEKALGSEHPEFAADLNNLAELYYTKREYAKAEPLYQHALAIVEKAFGREHPLVATSLNNLASLYSAKGEYAKAEPLYQRALTIYEKALGSEHPDLAANLNNLAELYYTKGEYAKAEPLYQRALAIVEKALGSEHPNVATFLNNLALLYEAEQDYPRAIEFLMRDQEIRESNINTILSTGSEKQKQLYLNTLSAETDTTVSLHAQSAPANAQAARLALTTILRRKGRALDVMTDQIAGLRLRAAPDDVKLLDALAAVQSQLANLQLSNDTRLSPAERRKRVTDLETEIEKLQDDIGRRNAEFRARSVAVTLDAVRGAIPTDAALVEILAYRPYNAKASSDGKHYGDARYVAYVLKPTSEAPQFVDLGEAAQIDADLKLWREALLDPDRTDVRQLGRRVDERVMRPVRKLLGDTKRLFISPDGVLNLIPFAALVDENNKYLMETYSLDYLTSGRDLLRLQVRSENRQGAVIFANPTYNLTAQHVAACDRRKPPRGLLLGMEDAYATNDKNTAPKREVEYLDIDFTQLCYPPLTGTAHEATGISAVLTNATVLTDKRATEAALKGLSAPSILHVATHGFFLADQPPPGLGKGRQLERPDAAPSGPQQENPMLRSGLILAGVNQTQSGPGEDGVLTAQEAAGLNLFGTKLVVLSACETGLGDVQNGAGVYGLRRALVLAGSETQVMSLWQVSDAATRDLMIGYYTRLQAGAGRIAAMHQVQLAMLRGMIKPRARDAKADWRHPYYWAAFIPSGSWLTLDGKEPK
jgi:CHAT domain-containing protein